MDRLRIEPVAGDDVAVGDRRHEVEPAPPRGAGALLSTYAGGFLMGSADLIPGVSGGTVALVVGIYERLIANIRQGARGLSLALRLDVRRAGRALLGVEWHFVAPLLAGILTAVVVLAGLLGHLLETQPVLLSALFFGLIVASTVVAFDEVERATAGVVAVGVVTAGVTFVGLGLRSGGQVTDPSLAMLFGAGALAICAMILPGISGSFILLMIGFYDTVLGYVNDRQLVELLVFTIGCALGLGAFATVLSWLLRRHHDLILGALIGLMAGSLRILWPWPAGADGVGDPRLGATVPSEIIPALVAAAAGYAAVTVITRLARGKV